MLIPRHWARADSEERAPDGRRVPFSVWRWSDSTVDDARSSAWEAARRIAERIRNGEPFPDRYAYGERPVREEIIREHRDEEGVVRVAITRNVYGSLILNTDRVMFIDVDIPDPGLWTRLLGWLRGAFRGRGDAGSAGGPASAPLARLREWVGTRSDWSVRAYRTRGGLRYLITHRRFEPGGSEAEEAMEFLGSDPRYTALCRVQKSFRARLTPKPWRCSLPLPPARYPYEDEPARTAMDRWRAGYEEGTQGWATCRLMESLGSGRIHPEADSIIRLHDQMTRAESELPLA